LSEEIFDKCLKNLFQHFSNEFLINAVNNIGTICGSAAFANPSKTLALFIPKIFNSLINKKNVKIFMKKKIKIGKFIN
jgi:hypothetical protein